MDKETQRRQKWAVKALGVHEKAYKRKIAARVRTFWESGEGWKHEGAILRAKLPGWSQKTHKMLVAPPSWSALEDSGLDDAVVGPIGDWKQAGDFLPIFASDGTSGFIVVEVAAPHAVGWFEEEAWQSTGKGYKTGVYLIADTLDAFLAKLEPPAAAAAKKKPAAGDDDDDLDDDNGDNPWGFLDDE